MKREFHKTKYSVKIENRGKCTSSELSITESLLDYLCNKFEKGRFMTISPKMFYILRKYEIKDDEICGFEFTLNSPYFKGRVEVRQKIDKTFRIHFLKRINNKGKNSNFELTNTIDDVDISNFNSHFEHYYVENEESAYLPIKKGDVVELKNGSYAIIRKYSSNLEIGIVYDEDDEDIEEFISKDKILRKLERKSK